MISFTPEDERTYTYNGGFAGISVITNCTDMSKNLFDLSVTGEGVAARGPSVHLSADKSIVRDGEELTLSFGVENPGPRCAVDLLGAVVLPDGTFLFYPGFSMDPQPVFVTLEENASIGPMEILRVPFSDALPKGTYSFYVAAINPYNCDMQIESNVASVTWVFE